MIAFLGMGGYWPFIWPAWGFAAAVLVALYAMSHRRARTAERLLAQAGARSIRARADLPRADGAET